MAADESPYLKIADYESANDYGYLGHLVEEVPPTQVPAPASLPLMLAGLAGLAWMRRRRAR